MFTLEYRPHKFSEVKGHISILKDLKKRAIDIKFPTAMLFEGLTGTGKTSVALIVAMTVNCDNPIKNKDGYHDPCQTCQSCRSIIDEKFGRDVLVFDGSNMGKDDVLDLENTAATCPTVDNARVIIIDEFQHLGAQAKGAVLKIVEKKRKDTIFILCTMDKVSIDKSVIDREQVYSFKPLTNLEIGDYLLDILEVEDPEEKIPEIFIKEGIPLLASASGGSLRSAVSRLERCINSELWTKEDIEKELDITTDEKIYKVIDMLLEGDYQAFEEIKKGKSVDNFNYIYTVVTSSFILANNPNSDFEDWKVKKSRAQISNMNFTRLLGVMLDTARSTNNYFNLNVFYSYLIEYYKGFNKPEKTRTRVPLNG